MGKKFTIAVMGASGVGKTVFFASYFHHVTDVGFRHLNDNKKHYQISIKSQDTDKFITQTIHTLFEEGRQAPPTDKLIDISFSVPALNMDIDIFDVPGGYTEDREAWRTEGILEKLHDAKGALFFISAEDLVKRPEVALSVNRVFANAVSEIRKHVNGKLLGRSDVPIWFVLTKGDTVPDVTEDELKSRIMALVEAAETSQEVGDYLSTVLFQKGRNVKTYKTTSMGKWKAQTPPSEYHPVNVIEPMEDLFMAMLRSKGRYMRVLKIIFTVIASGTLITVFAFSWWLDSNHWKNTLVEVQRARESDNYAEAISILDKFRPPVLSKILFLPFMRAGGELKAVRDEVYKDYEAALYAPIAPEIQKVNVDTLPTVDDLFKDTVKKVEEYLAVIRFAEINPEHYEQVRNNAWYFETGRLLAFEQDNNDVSPDEEFHFIVQCLNYEPPETWREQVHARIGRLLYHWATTLPLNATIDNCTNYINKVNQLSGYPDLSEKLMMELYKYRDAWKLQREDLIVNEDLAALLNFTVASSDISPDEKFNLIQLGLNYKAPDRWNERIKSAVDSVLHYWLESIPSNASISNYTTFIDRASQLSQNSVLSLELVKELDERRNLWIEHREDLIVDKAVGSVLNFNAAERNYRPDTEFDLILLGLNYDAPERWRERVMSATSNIVYHWCRTLGADANIEQYENYISKVSQLTAHPAITAEITAFLNERKEIWTKEMNDKWLRLALSWISEATSNSVQPEEGLMILSRHMSEKLPPEIRDMLKEAQDNLYEVISDKAILENPDDAGELEVILRQFPNMTVSAKAKLQEQIASINAQKLAEALAKIQGSKTLEELSKAVRQLEVDRRNAELISTINNVLQNLVEARLKTIREEAGTAINLGEFLTEKKKISSSCQSLIREIQGIADRKTSQTYTSKITSTEQELLNMLMNEHADYCKQEFHKRKNSNKRQDVNQCLVVLQEFITIWPDNISSGVGADVRRASRFLQAIQGGVRGRLQIVEGSFSSKVSMYVKVEAQGREVFRTGTISGRSNPSFREGREFTWSVESPNITVTAVDEGWVWDGYPIKKTIELSGFEGYKNLSTKLVDGKSFIIMYFTPNANIPEAPKNW